MMTVKPIYPAITAIMMVLASVANAQIIYEDDFSSYTSGGSIAGPDWDPKMMEDLIRII